MELNINSNTIGAIGSIYRVLLPESFRQHSIVAKLKAQLLMRLGHDWIYNPFYYSMHVEGPAFRSAKTIATSILSDFVVKSVVDVGCGTGALLEALRDRGCNVFGLEYSQTALDYCHSRQLDVMKFDLKRDAFTGDRTFDVAVSMEVAEHLPDMVSDRYIDLLANLSPVIVFTSAPPGQGGADHVNEQPPSYWATKFQQRGFERAEAISQRWRENWRAAGDVESWYYKNLMLFRRVSGDQKGMKAPGKKVGHESVETRIR